MALGDTGKAIAATTDALRLGLHNLLHTRTGLNIIVGRPDEVTERNQLNLFLYEIVFDASLKNTPLDDGQPAPLWLVLKYVMTAFDAVEGGSHDSDTVKAHEFLGEGMRALQALNYLKPPASLLADYIKAITPNPEELKITFDEASPELMSKLMQGSNDKYHLSVAFQVRPVLIAPPEPASYSLLVGIDYAVTPPTPPIIIGEAGIHIPLLPSLGPTITSVEPESFEPGDVVTVHGTDLHLSGLSVSLGPVDLPVVSQRPDRLEFEARANLLTDDRISAGGHALTVAQELTPTRRRRSNILVANLLPVLDTAAFTAPVTVDAGPPVTAFGTILLTGTLLGKDDDDVFLVLYRDGETVRVMDYFTKEALIPGPPAPAQTRKHLEMRGADDSIAGDADAVPRGIYNVILRVNGVQAKQSPVIVF
jgi:hypothetical protein